MPLTLPSPTDPATFAALLDAYRHGAFPMARSRRGKSVSFFTADPRAIVPIDPADPACYRAARSVRAIWRRGVFEVRTDTDFRGVITACAEAKRDGTWINDWMIEAYTSLHRAGHAHSVEAWRAESAGAPRRLVGGLYGVHIGSAFFGESMFHEPGIGDDASKVCLAALVAHLQARGFRLLDTQFINDHMRRQGAVEIPASDYLVRLGAALSASALWSPWGSPGSQP